MLMDVKPNTRSSIEVKNDIREREAGVPSVTSTAAFVQAQPLVEFGTLAA